MIKDIHEVKECPDCASQNLVYQDRLEQVICRDCGLIFEPLIPQLEERFEKAHGLMEETPAEKEARIKKALKAKKAAGKKAKAKPAKKSKAVKKPAKKAKKGKRR